MTTYRIKRPRRVGGGNIHASIEVEDKITKQVIHREDHDEPLPTMDIPDGYAVGVVSASNGITLSANFQGVRVDVGGEMPWPVRPGNLEDFGRGLDAFEDMIDERLARKARGLKALLKRLG